MDNGDWVYDRDEWWLLGNLIETVTTYTGIAKLVYWYTAITGRDCGCERRRILCNKMHITLLDWIKEKHHDSTR